MLVGFGFCNHSAIATTVITFPAVLMKAMGVNLQAIKHLIHGVGADVIITMDTGITANIEAAFCKEHGVDFICTDHHVIGTSPWVCFAVDGNFPALRRFVQISRDEQVTET